MLRNRWSGGSKGHYPQTGFGADIIIAVPDAIVQRKGVGFPGPVAVSPDHMGFTLGHVSRVGGVVDHRGGRIIIRLVDAPLLDVSDHVIEAVAVGRKRTYRRAELPHIRASASVAIGFILEGPVKAHARRQVFRITNGIGIVATPVSGPFPFYFMGKPVDEPGGGRFPLGEPLTETNGLGIADAVRRRVVGGTFAVPHVRRFIQFKLYVGHFTGGQVKRLGDGDLVNGL